MCNQIETFCFQSKDITAHFVSGQTAKERGLHRHVSVVCAGIKTDAFNLLILLPRVVKVAWRQRLTTPTQGTSRGVTSPLGKWPPISTALWSCPRTRRVSGLNK